MTPARRGADPRQLSFSLQAEGAAPVGNIYCGTCGWTDRTLIQSKRFYPPEVKTADRLPYYASQFPIVEVDSTFYAPPSAENARLWNQRSPAGFRFNVKAYGLLTHHRVATRTLPHAVLELLPASTVNGPSVALAALPPSGRELIWAQHATALEPLANAGKLGAVLFQFPRWFVNNQKNRDYLRELAGRLPYRIAVEFRGGGWMLRRSRAETLKLLEALGLTYVMVDEPLGFKSSTPPVIAQTSPLAMIRMHGRNKDTWEKRVATAAERFRYLYAAEELAPWVETASFFAHQSEAVHVLMNNCYQDYAVRGARLFGDLLGSALRDRPDAVGPASVH